ncbi:hypothetical protein KY359_06035 [Candidatus Woesearchaeota archaeon]|nr:hypothetical protein [Candidatus Woesearchaeota archaeon]
MSFEPTVIINGVSQLAASVVSLLLALKLRKQKSCVLQKPFFLLSLALFCIAFLNAAWFFGIIDISGIDNALVVPFFHLAILAVWFYICFFISGHDHIYYLIPIFLMSINALLLINSLAVLCDVITGLVLIGVFFYVGFIEHNFMKKVSLVGMVYGFFIAGASVLAYATEIPYLESFWFVPNSVLFYLLFIMLIEGHVCKLSLNPSKHHVPLVVEVFKLGFFVVGLSVFLMLGTLGVHELGHSLAAKIFGCSHSTVFGIGSAVTHVSCSSGAGENMIAISGFILTLFVAMLIYFMGYEFSQRLATLILAFSMLIAVDDFTMLGLPKSVFVILIFIAALLIGYGIVLIVRNYEQEYHTREAGVCVGAKCEGKGI